MSSGAQIPDDNALAGEYVLGVLPLAERRMVEERMARDSDFRGSCGLVAVGSFKSRRCLYARKTRRMGSRRGSTRACSPKPPGRPAVCGARWSSGAVLPSPRLPQRPQFSWRSSTPQSDQDRLSGPDQASVLVAELGAEGSCGRPDRRARSRRTAPSPSLRPRFHPMTASRSNCGWWQTRAPSRSRWALCPVTAVAWSWIRALSAKYPMAPCSPSVSSLSAARRPARQPARSCSQVRSPENNPRH
jgi:hypothetical protein